MDKHQEFRGILEVLLHVPGLAREVCRPMAAAQVLPVILSHSSTLALVVTTTTFVTTTAKEARSSHAIISTVRPGPSKGVMTVFTAVLRIQLVLRLAGSSFLVRD